VSLGFFLQKLMPGGPIEALRQDIRQNPEEYGLPPSPTAEQINEVVETLVEIQPDQPLHVAYADYLHSVFIEFELGTSIVVANNVPVIDLVLARAPWTVFISSIGLLYGLLAGIAFGSMMAYYEGSKFDIGLTVSMILDSAVPYYIAAIGLLFVFGFQLDYFPTGGRSNPDATAGLNWQYVSSIFYYAALPALATILTGFGGSALGLRANSIRLLGDEYLRVAHLRCLARY
jgi:peptide/nickel transport system permease protein